MEVKKFFNDGVFNTLHNHTNICMIAKINPPNTMSDLRPIALCNVTYKVISKILVNRLKIHLNGMIAENQAAFIPERMIIDNVIIAHEIFHALKVRKRQSGSYMVVKTDITKAYDKIECEFIRETMTRMGFDPKWINWIMTCITTVSFSVMINGEPKGYVQPERGIRQGDLLPPYIFIMC